MTDIHVARDMVQARLLGGLFSHSLRGQVALKGGFAMRVLAGSHRYTDDIDLASSPEVSASFVDKCVKKAVADLRNSGLIQDLRLVDKSSPTSDTTMRWRVHGVVGGHEINLKVEVSRRNQLDSDHMQEAEYSTVPGFPPVRIGCIDLPSIAAAKVDCLKNPKREAPRDIFDLYLLVTMDVRPKPGVLQRYSVDELVELRSLIWDKLEKMDYETARQQLLGFLPASAAVKLTESVWDEMRLVVGEKITEWVNGELSEGDPVPAFGAMNEEVAARAL